MTPRTWTLTTIAAGVLLTGCAATQSTAGSAGPSTVTSPAAATSIAAGQSMAGTSMPSPSPGTGRPTATALMVCSDDIKTKVKQVLKLPGQPVTTAAYTNDVYTCTYRLPIGPLLLSVQHSATKAAANAYYDREKTSLGPTESILGLGENAYGAPSGVAVVMKDNQTLIVDARGLPAVFGAEQQKRTDLANEIASDVLGCWTGNN